jgi:hypothetical protein
MRRGHGHRPVPELRPDDPRHGDREGRNVNVDDVTIQGKTSIHHRGTEDTEGSLFFFACREIPTGENRPSSKASKDQSFDTVSQHRDIEID